MDVATGMNEWIRVEDQLPKDGEQVMCWIACEQDGRGDMVILDYDVYDEDEDESLGLESGFYAGESTPTRIPFRELIDNVTHWMRLPEAPNEGKQRTT